MYIKDKLEEFCKRNNHSFHVGNRQILNMLERPDDYKCDQIYIMVERFVDTPLYSPTLGNRTQTAFSGEMFIVVKSDMDMPYYKEVDSVECKNKLDHNILPLYKVRDSLENFFICDDAEIREFQTTSVTNILDANFDGLYIRFNIVK